MGDNFFENPVQAKRAMRDNLFTEVYLSTAVTTPIQLKGWVSQPNPYERHGQRWHLYLSRVELLRRVAARQPEERFVELAATAPGAPSCGPAAADTSMPRAAKGPTTRVCSARSASAR